MEEHPSIDSLRTFAADRLKKDERRSVLEHLIQCEGCRESLALVTPEEDPPALDCTFEAALTLQNAYAIVT